MRSAIIPFAALALSLSFAFSQPNPSQEIKPMNVKRITPVLLVQEIEPLIPFWVGRLASRKQSRCPKATNSDLWRFRKEPPK